MKKIFLILSLFSLLTACEKDADYWTNKRPDKLHKHNEKKVTITEGIWGTLIQMEGNLMPQYNPKKSTKTFPIQREILFYEYTTKEGVNRKYDYIYEVYTKLIATTTSDKEGFFELKLVSGKYSVFVKEKNYLYPVRRDEDGGISTITIPSSKVRDAFFVLDYLVY